VLARLLVAWAKTAVLSAMYISLLEPSAKFRIIFLVVISSEARNLVTLVVVLPLIKISPFGRDDRDWFLKKIMVKQYIRREQHAGSSLHQLQP